MMNHWIKIIIIIIVWRQIFLFVQLRLSEVFTSEDIVFLFLPQTFHFWGTGVEFCEFVFLRAAQSESSKSALNIEANMR